MKIEKLITSQNIAEDLKEEELVKIGKDVYEGFHNDLSSREAWVSDLDRWTKLALQVTENKTYPWKDASNVKYPLLSTAAMQFSARAYPSLVPSDGKVVKFQTKGFDPDGSKAEKANRVSKHMSYQIIEEMDNWEADMDRLLLILPITGIAFKKTYYNVATASNVSKLIYPTDLVVNYWATSLEEAERKTEIIPMSKRLVKEKQLMGIYLDVELPQPSNENLGESQRNEKFGIMDVSDDTMPYILLEQHTFLDLDGDGYSEPYCVLIEKESQKVLRITARFDEEHVLVDDSGKVLRITPIEYYTKYSFVPNPDGGFYDIGFGRLLGSINASIDTLVNQLVDAGTLNNLQSGFIGKGLRIKMGESSFTPGEWKAVNATGDDIKKQIFPLPTKEPSPVLMNLLQFLLQSGKELASVAEIFVGKMPGQNTPATTTMATIEQGMKVFTAVYKRIFRSLTEEFRKLYILNQKYIQDEQYIDVLGEVVTSNDYSDNPKFIYPAADPQATAAQEKMTKAQNLIQVMSLGTLDPMQVTQYLLEAFEIPNADQFLIQQPQGDPNAQAQQQQMQQEMEMKQQESQMKMQESQMKMQLAQTTAQAKLEAENAKAKIQLAAEEQKASLQKESALTDIQFKRMQAIMESRIAAGNNAQNMSIKDSEHRQKMVMRERESQQKSKMSSQNKNSSQATPSEKRKPSK